MKTTKKFYRAMAVELNETGNKVLRSLVVAGKYRLAYRKGSWTKAIDGSAGITGFKYIVDAMHRGMVELPDCKKRGCVAVEIWQCDAVLSADQYPPAISVDYRFRLNPRGDTNFPWPKLTIFADAVRPIKCIARIEIERPI